MRPKGMEDLAAFSAKDVKSTAAKKRERASIPLQKDSASHCSRQSHPSELSES